MKRPLGLTIIGWLAVVGGALQVLGALGLVGVGSLGLLIGSTGAFEWAVLGRFEFPWWTGVALIAGGALGLIFGYGVLEERSWSWPMGIVLYLLNLLGAGALLYATGVGATMVFVAVISIVIIGYLLTPTVREALGHGAGGGMTPHAPHPA